MFALCGNRTRDLLVVGDHSHHYAKSAVKIKLSIYVEIFSLEIILYLFMRKEQYGFSEIIDDYHTYDTFENYNKIPFGYVGIVTIILQSFLL
jgi:hypothetical protein